MVPRQAVVRSAMRLASPAASAQAIDSMSASFRRSRKALSCDAPGVRM